VSFVSFVVNFVDQPAVVRATISPTDPPCQWPFQDETMTTPVRRQYLALKKRFPDALLLFRLGDFYETFDDDARLLSQELDLVLTGRDIGQGQRIPLAGIPYHAADSYIARLIQKGYKVAIAEQLSDPATSKGLLDRDVVRVITPGTLVEPHLLNATLNNYLAAVVVEEDRAGLAYCDVSTGEFAATQIEAGESHDTIPQALQRELARLQPAEILLPASPTERTHRLIGGKSSVSSHPLSGSSRQSATDEEQSSGTISSAIRNLQPPIANLHYPISPYDHWRFNLETARNALQEHFGVATLDGFGLAGRPLAMRAAGAIIQYLQETQKPALSQLTGLTVYSTQRFMNLDPATRRNLEINQAARSGAIKGSLLAILDLTKTAMGGRLLRRWLNQPLIESSAINARLDAVDAFYKNTRLREGLLTLLSKVADLERLANRAGQRLITPREMIALKSALQQIPRIQDLLAEYWSGSADAGHDHQAQIRNPQANTQSLISKLHPCPEISDLIGKAIVDEPPANLSEGGVIRPGFSAELDSIHLTARNAKTWIAGLEQKERDRTGIKSLKVGYNKIFGYYIEVTTPNLSLVPADYIRKQTIAGGERFITPDLKEYETLVLNAQERIVDLETQIYRQVVEQVAAAGPQLQQTAMTLATLDVVAALAEAAVRHHYVRPTLADDDVLDIKGGRHPIVEKSQETPFVPNDTRLSNHDCQIMILTGPNMAGKSVALRQVALIVLMAQIGSFVPADSAHIGVVDRIFSRVGAQDDIATGQSTFMVEMIETALLLQQATPRSLLILDEIGRGTSTYDGLAIARAVVEYIHNSPRLGCKTLFATHYHELTELEKYLPRVKNYNMAVTEEGEQVVFLHKIVPGGADKSYGIHVAKMAGVPRPVVRRAEEILQDLEKSGAKQARRQAMRDLAVTAQLPLFSTGPDPVVVALRELAVDELSPLEALTKLYELQQQAKGNE